MCRSLIEPPIRNRVFFPTEQISMWPSARSEFKKPPTNAPSRPPLFHSLRERRENNKIKKTANGRRNALGVRDPEKEVGGKNRKKERLAQGVMFARVGDRGSRAVRNEAAAGPHPRPPDVMRRGHGPSCECSHGLGSVG